MDLKWLLCISAFACISVKMSSSSRCTLTRDSYEECGFTITCDSNPARVYNLPTCEEENHITFIITNSHLTLLIDTFFQSTNFDRDVTEIKAFDNDWFSIYTDAFRYYINCIRIDLSNNHIKKIYSEAFNRLVKLTHLNISRNDIEVLSQGAFSTNGINVIEVLDLSYNKLTGINDDLNHMPNLKTLYLQNNMLSSIADDALVNIKYLDKLYLQNNKLVTLNVTLTNIKHLTTLDLSNNYLFQLSGFEINRLVSLVYANFSHNAITFVDSSCFKQAFNLKQVDFSYNKINHTIESVMFSNSNELEYLDFFDNHITGLQSFCFQHNNINYINLRNNNISGDIGEYTFGGARGIPTLDLSQQNITSIRNKSFTGVENMHNLNLSKNSIEVIEISSFINATIKTIDMSYNKVRDVDFMKNCLTDLIGLILSYNNIQVISTRAFESQTEMVYLDLSMNNIVRIEPNSLPLVKLQILNVAGNQLNGTIEKYVFSPAKYLKYLDLNNFNFSMIDEKAFVDMPVLARLNLSHNLIESIAPYNFKGANNIFSLDISYNRLRYFNSSYLPNLQALYLNDNNLESNMSSIFSTSVSLLYLDISNNNITDVSAIGSETFPNLTTLNLSQNRLKNFSNQKTNNLTTLITLRLSSNELNSIELSTFKKLILADLSNNSLSHINSTLLRNLQHLQLLDLSMNKIKHLPPGTFQYMKSLKSLNLSENSITKLRYGSLRGLSNIIVLDISKNKIASLEIAIFHECSELETLIIDYNRIKMFDVQSLIYSLPKLGIISLGANPISCEEIIKNIRSVNTTVVRRLNVTSVDKIYHEDNVHGIKCGDSEFEEISLVTSTTVKPEMSTVRNEVVSSSSPITAVLIWCTVLTILLISAAVAFFIMLYKKRILVVDDHSKNSLELEGAEFQNNLLD